MICIFGGTAAYHLTPADFGNAESLPPLDTPFGPAPIFLRFSLPSPVGVFSTARKRGPGVGVLFSSRHGADKLARSAAFVNHCANLWAAKEYGATAILSWNGVGAINPMLNVGDKLVPDDLIDATRARDAASFQSSGTPSLKGTFWEAGRAALIESATPAFSRGVYVCTEGPRLETPAEIAAFAQMGADVVGMTLVPEVFLADEMSLPYASLCIVTNIASGLARPGSPRRFGPEVAREGLALCLKAAQLLEKN
ncbi:MAG: MTAP family purine nucleoside phosphorylase [Chloroflexi bacterium]|nr:MTAP family purine nucleoside phosphorylase [Chloroflexota bacterium]